MKRWRPSTWLLLSLLLFVAAALFWRLGDKWAKQAAEPASGTTDQAMGPEAPAAVPVARLSQSGALNSPPITDAESATEPQPAPQSPLAYRLSNTTKTVDQLARSEKAILLENALLDTARPTDLAIPGHLHVQGEPGSYIVQSRGPLDSAFRALLKQAGATIISYIPNNAYLVRASAGAAQQLSGDSRTQTVLPYQPYYKLKSSLLGLAVEQEPLPADTVLNVVLFADARDATVEQVRKLGAEIVGEDQSPFGPVLKVAPPAESLPALAGLSGVKELEMAQVRKPANDLSRPTIGVAVDTVSPTNYLGLTGNGVVVGVSDTGVDATHPDLAGRVFLDANDVLRVGAVDAAGHGTHVAGIIAGSGLESTTVTNAQGSLMPGTNLQFRGKAPAALLLSLNHSFSTNNVPHTGLGTVYGAFLNLQAAIAASAPDFYLQQTAARSNVFIANNGWNYGNSSYDISAASYDAAVRDSLPGMPGAKPILYVFPAGNAGGGGDNGQGGGADSVLSPGTAKNVITVGAAEQVRNITNLTWKCTTTGSNPGCTTNEPWLASTDNSFQVASFSGRGNVGVSVEGKYGRFKPDVVAPGTFVISTCSSQWDKPAYYNPTSHIYWSRSKLPVDTNSLWINRVFVPENALRLTISVSPNENSPRPFPPTPIFVRQADLPSLPSTYDMVGTNWILVLTNGLLSPVGAYWYYGIGNTTPNTLSFNVATDIMVTNDWGNYLEVLSNLNNSIGPYYRYESGSSMAAASVSGTLALMQEFFEQRLGRTNSPALMKALLINGATSLGSPYSYQVATSKNFQGWGEVTLPNSIPMALANPNASGGAPMFMFDQSPDKALVTGQSQTYFIKVDPEALGLPLRATLVWTDPPGDPAASIKLVNDLDLVITNLDTGDIYFGNNIPSGKSSNLPWNTNNPPNLDIINNVENVYLGALASTNYSVTVVGRRVNVNALPAHPDNVAQDYALVISAGSGTVTNALTLSSTGPIVSAGVPFVTAMTNSFVGNPDFSGGILFQQHVGANSPLIGTNTISLADATNPNPWPALENGNITFGTTNQWHFYTLTNDMGFTNAAFLTFFSTNLSIPRMGVTNVNDPANGIRPEADIDLYVSTDYTLTNLNFFAISNAYKSLGRGGKETIILSNALPTVYYAAVKSEDQMAAEYAFLGIFSRLPFSDQDEKGNQRLRGFPVPQAIPDAYLDVAGKIQNGNAYIVAISPMSIPVRRAIVTNVLSHEMERDLIGTLSHDSGSAILNNHTTNAAVINQVYVYDDSDQHDVPGAIHTDGPGSLHDFAGREGAGQWMMIQSDGVPTQVGTNGSFFLWLERQQDLTGGVTNTIQPGACSEDFVDVPAQATNLTIEVTILSNAPANISVQVCPRDSLGVGCKSTNLVTGAVGDTVSITIDNLDVPPLQAGTYSVRVCNNGDQAVTVYIIAKITLNTGAANTSLSSHGGPVDIQDDAVTYAYLTNLYHGLIGSLDVGMLINDPRISDLAITLISPHGTRVLLMENRGAWSTNGLGSFVMDTNGVIQTYTWAAMAPFYTNGFEGSLVGPYVPGAVFEGWSVLTNSVFVYPELPAPWLSNNVLMLQYGAVSNALPTTNSTVYHLDFDITHAPYLVGTVGWWPFDGEAVDIFGGLDGLLCGDVMFVNTGKVNQAYFGDGVATRMRVPACPALNVGRRRGFTIEGWINPVYPSSSVMSDGFEGATPQIDVPAGSYINGWRVESGNVDVLGPLFVPDTGDRALDLNGTMAGSISTNFNTVPGKKYQFSFAYAKNPNTGNPAFVAQATVSLTGQPDWALSYGAANSNKNPNWFHTSYVFTASSTITKLKLTSLNQGSGGMFLDSFNVSEALPIFAAPLVNWSVSNAAPQGVQFWLAGLPNSNSIPGSLWANIWDTNGQPHIIGMTTNALTNDVWQHVALTYDAATFEARLYTNGQRAVVKDFPTNFVPSTVGDLYFGFIPGNPAGLSPAPVTTGSPQVLGGPIINPANGHLYYLGAPTNWFGAQALAASLGGYLVTINDAAENQWVFNTFGWWGRVAREPWLGLNDYAQEGVYVWLDGEPATYRNWAPGEPNNGGGIYPQEDGVTMWPPTSPVPPGSWTDVAIDHIHPSVIEISVSTNNISCFKGGLDEFGLYDRALTDCEIAAIFKAGSAGKYGTNVLTCPLTNSPNGASVTVQLANALGTTTYTFTNGLYWTNGPQWETDSIDFANLFLGPTNGVATNWTSIILTNADPNATVDNFVLWGMLTNSLSGYFHFTENTNLALLPIKYAGLPYTTSNFPPTLIFSNDFEVATQRVYAAGSVIPGSTNNPAFGQISWSVTNGPVTVMSNAFLDAFGTNCVALATGGLWTTLPTIAGHRYQLTYSLRGPGAVSWWSGDVEPLSRRAWDLLGGNNGAFIHTAGTSSNGFVNARNDSQTLSFPGVPWPITEEPWYASAPKIDLSDPANLRLTNCFTIEGWIDPIPPHTNDIAVSSFQQILFRGDARDCQDPYYLALVYDWEDWRADLVFHVESADSPGCGVSLVTTNGPIRTNTWQHIAAVFESNVQWTNNAPWPTNELRLYRNGVLLTNILISDPAMGWIATSLTGERPFSDLDPNYQPGVAIGNNSRYDNSEPFCGYLDELSVYGRALTEPEIAAIHAKRRAGKADLSVQPGLSLAKLSVAIDGSQRDVAYGDNAHWDTRTITFTALSTNSVLSLQSLLPGTIVDGITLTEIPAEINYLPETSLDALTGEDGYGVWTLEIWDNRVGATNYTPQLVNWQLNFNLLPSNPPPIITLSHGVTYTNSLPAYGMQNFIVPVPQWAIWATNTLQFANQYRVTNNALSVDVWFNTNWFPGFTTNDLVLLSGSSGTTNLTTNTVTAPWITSGQPYYLAVSNPNPVSATFALGVWFDITTLTNCEATTNFVGPAGIPRYFQFDVPAETDTSGLLPQQAFFWLSGVQSNVTVVLSQHLPLPDLTHYDYISQQPCTNEEVVMLVTNITPFPLQTNRWYIGVFNSAATNVPFTVQACYTTSNSPTIIPLTNGVPFFANLVVNTNFIAPPGPPRGFFFEFQITNWTDAVLFELYDLSGDADLLLQRDVPPSMASYWDTSFRTGRLPEQIVLRTGPDLSDLRGNWYLGVYNNEFTNVTFTIRAYRTYGWGKGSTNALLLSGQPLHVNLTVRPYDPGNLLLSWNSIEGEFYTVEYTDSLTPPIQWQLWPMPNGGLFASTPWSTVQVPVLRTGQRFYRVVQGVPTNLMPQLYIRLAPPNQVRISWSTSYTGFTLQSSPSLTAPVWSNVNLPVTTIGTEFVVYDIIGGTAKYYRLIR